uniref:Chemokine interleukin-8-like domain-containing protein n=1 Tax=Hippocampus comes TaxID=109280 RepID=A0A3Q3D970_HIPCM
MLNSGSLQKTFLLAAVLVALVQLGKPTECCTKVSSKEITEEVLGFRVQIPQAKCLPAIMKAAAEAAQALTASPPAKSSPVAILTSTASAPSSSPSPPSSSSSPSTSSYTFSPRLRPTLH